MNNISDKYDVIIIGAGIGGLVCGCYLAKSGMKVLIAEKNSVPGGYCTSFRRRNFVFDSAVRGLVGCGKDNILGKIFNEIGLNSRVDINRSHIFDKIVTPDFTVSLKDDYRETAEDIKKAFPKEQNAIEIFFNLLTTKNFLKLYSTLKGKNFQELLDEVFSDSSLKSLWNIMRADTGLLPSKTSALAGISLCRGYILDGGYYPKGGMQEIPNGLADIFREVGGDIIFSSCVEKIEVKNHKAVGVRLKDGNVIQSMYIVSNCDAMHTFANLIDNKFINKRFLKLVKNLVPSPSVFIVYLGLKKKLNEIDRCCAMWCFPSRPTNKDYDVVFNNNVKTSSKYVVCVFPSFNDLSMAPTWGESIYLYIGASFEDVSYWKRNREKVADDIISRAAKFIPEVANSIEIKETATPQTLYRYTYNYKGASRGWAALNSQTSFDLISSETPIENLFLAGHWITCPTGQGGVAMAAYSGRNVAKIILKGEK